MARLIRALLAVLAPLALMANRGPVPPSVPPSVPGVDAPQLARLGPDQVGFRTIRLVHKAQPDFTADSAADGSVPLRDRPLMVDLWYPAKAQPRATAATYRASLYGEPPRPPVSFTVSGLAHANAPASGTRHPLVIVSHGYSNAPAVMTWLCENLASKGYVVAAIHHEDPNPYVIASARAAAPNYHRPVDIAFVAAALRRDLGALIDPENVALIGYSQGGYGVLAAGGARLDPAGPLMDVVPGGWLKRLARGTATEGQGKVPGVRAIVAMAPAGGQPRSAWGAEGLASITAPLLLIQGDADPVVDYKSGALAVFEGATRAERHLLTYRQAGHAIALNPAPAAMRGSLWDMDWFEDPIWRADRVVGINLHFITAFLAANLRGQSEMRRFLDVAVENGADGVWDAPPGTAWGAFSPGGSEITLWPGFQRRHAAGLNLRHASP